jgi:hypothetical protein
MDAKRLDSAACFACASILFHLEEDAFVLNGSGVSPA